MTIGTIIRIKGGRRLVLISRLRALGSVFTPLAITIALTKMPLRIIAFRKGYKTTLCIIKTIAR
jgi:hypothetical protein